METLLCKSIITLRIADGYHIGSDHTVHSLYLLHASVKEYRQHCHVSLSHQNPIPTVSYLDNWLVRLPWVCLRGLETPSKLSCEVQHVSLWNLHIVFKFYTGYERGVQSNFKRTERYVYVVRVWSEVCCVRVRVFCTGHIVTVIKKVILI